MKMTEEELWKIYNDNKYNYTMKLTGNEPKAWICDCGRKCIGLPGKCICPKCGLPRGASS